jgi:hypothetical protein
LADLAAGEFRDLSRLVLREEMKRFSNSYLANEALIVEEITKP